MRHCGLAVVLRRSGAVLLMAVSVLTCAAQQAARPTVDMTPVKPESVGFSSERLEKLHTLMQDAVDHQQVAGVVTILARHGKIVDYRAYGMRDIASKDGDDEGHDLSRLLDDQAGDGSVDDVAL